MEHLQAVGENLNNDVEGWHHGLHRRASSRSQLPMYLLIDLLHREARLTSLHIRLVSEKKLCRVQRKKYRSLQSLGGIQQWREKCTSALEGLFVCEWPDVLIPALSLDFAAKKNGSFRSHHIYKSQ